MSLRIELPFPPAALNPNRVRGHFGQTLVAKSKAWDDAYVLAHQAIKAHAGPWTPLEGDIPVTLTFHQPDKRGRDLDNLLSAMKRQIDAIATALTINDKHFCPITLRRGDVVKGGAVIVEIGA